jgi:hypothetical protein
MCDQAALRVDNVGVAALADLDLRNHVPDQLEIDLGHAHAGIAPRPGDGQGHIGLGLAAEIDRPVVDLLCRRLGEFRIVGKVAAARHHVHGQARNPQPLLACCVDLGQLGDGGHLAQQPQGIEAALLDRARRPRQLRRPAELALDLPGRIDGGYCGSCANRAAWTFGDSRTGLGLRSVPVGNTSWLRPWS